MPAERRQLERFSNRRQVTSGIAAVGSHNEISRCIGTLLRSAVEKQFRTADRQQILKLSVGNKLPTLQACLTAYFPRLSNVSLKQRRRNRLQREDIDDDILLDP